MAIRSGCGLVLGRNVRDILNKIAASDFLRTEFDCQPKFILTLSDFDSTYLPISTAQSITSHFAYLFCIVIAIFI